MLIGLIRKVTGVTISAFFKDKTGYKYSGREMEMPWHNRAGFGHNIRKYRMRSASVSVCSECITPAMVAANCCIGYSIRKYRMRSACIFVVVSA